MRTSSATTANPLPATPAHAASTAAFKARIFVWGLPCESPQLSAHKMHCAGLARDYVQGRVAKRALFFFIGHKVAYSDVRPKPHDTLDG